MKKVLFVTNMFPSKKNAAFGTFVKETYDWIKEKYNTKLVCMTYEENKYIKACKYILFNSKIVVCGLMGNFDIIYVHYISHSAYAIRIIKKIRKDIIIVGNVHGDDALSYESRFRKNIKRSKLFINNSDYIIVPSEAAKKKLKSIYDISDNKVFVSPSGGINRRVFFPIEKDKAKRELGVKNKIVIGYVSRLVEEKGWDTFIDLIKKIEEKNVGEMFEYLLIGSGPSEDEVSKMIKEYNLENRIMRFPRIAHNKLYKYYNAMDIFCLFSKIKTETLGLVGLEAMACGVPCLVTKVDGFLSYAVDNYNSWCIEIDDVESALNIILQYLEMNNEVKEKLGMNSINTASNYDSDTVKNTFLDFFANIMAVNGDVR